MHHGPHADLTELKAPTLRALGSHPGVEIGLVIRPSVHDADAPPSRPIVGRTLCGRLVGAELWRVTGLVGTADDCEGVVPVIGRAGTGVSGGGIDAAALSPGTRLLPAWRDCEPGVR